MLCEPGKKQNTKHKHICYFLKLLTMFPPLAQIKLKICNQSNTNMGTCYIVMERCTQETHTHL